MKEPSVLLKSLASRANAEFAKKYELSLKRALNAAEQRYFEEALKGDCKDRSSILTLLQSERGEHDELLTQLRDELGKAGRYDEGDFQRLVKSICRQVERDILQRDITRQWPYVADGKLEPSEFISRLQQQVSTASAVDALKSLEESKKIQSEPLIYMVEGIFAKKCLSMLSSQSGQGKTTLIASAINSMRAGKKVWGRFESLCEVRPLIMSSDMPAPEFGEYARRIGIDWVPTIHKTGMVDSSNTGVKGMSLKKQKCLEAWAEIIKEVKPNFLVVDTLQAWLEMDTWGERFYTTINWLKDIANEYNCHVHIVHHDKKPPAALRDRANQHEKATVSGSTYSVQSVSCLIQCGKEKESGRSIIRVGKERSGVGNVAIGYEIVGDTVAYDSIEMDFDVSKQVDTLIEEIL